MADDQRRQFRAAAWKEQASEQINRLGSIDLSLRIIADTIGRIEVLLTPPAIAVQTPKDRAPKGQRPRRQPPKRRSPRRGPHGKA